MQAIKPDRTCPTLNQQRGHVYIKTSMWGGVGRGVTLTQKCQASLVIRESSVVAMNSLTSTIRPRPLTLCNLFMSKQTLSGSWKYKCQVFPHENSCDLNPGDKRGPLFLLISALPHFLISHSLFFSFIPLSRDFFSSSPSPSLFLFLSLSPHLCAVAHRTCPVVVESIVVTLCGSC